MPFGLYRPAATAGNLGLVDARGELEALVSGTGLRIAEISPAVFPHSTGGSQRLAYATLVQCVGDSLRADAEVRRVLRRDAIIDPRRLGQVLEKAISKVLSQVVVVGSHNHKDVVVLPAVLGQAIEAMLDSGELSLEDVTIAAADLIDLSSLLPADAQALRRAAFDDQDIEAVKAALEIDSDVAKKRLAWAAMPLSYGHLVNAETGRFLATSESISSAALTASIS